MHIISNALQVPVIASYEITFPAITGNIYDISLNYKQSTHPVKGPQQMPG
jgi:hypothetical protein